MKHTVALLLLATLLSWISPAVAANREQELTKEREKLLKEKDPVDRTKIGIKVSEILLASVGDAIEAGDYDKMNERLNEYAVAIEDANSAITSSGRDAGKKAAGFKELEIALRKHVLRFDDLARALSLERRIPVEKVKGRASGIREGLLKALFH